MNMAKFNIVEMEKAVSAAKVLYSRFMNGEITASDIMEARENSNNEGFALACVLALHQIQDDTMPPMY